MAGVVEFAETTLSRLDARSVLDVLIIALIFYGLLVLLRGTSAMSLVRGIIILLLLGFILSNVFQLTMLNWLLRNSLTALLIGIPILFQPELRRALERIGRTGFRALATESSLGKTINTIADVSSRLSERRYGALMVLERETGLQDFIDTGVMLDAVPSAELLMGLFYPNSPLHDGAVVLRAERILAAGCVLPLSDNSLPGSQLGTRHRAALGITERTDAISVVVSEETGAISVATNGRMVSRLDEQRLRRILGALCGVETPPQPFAYWRREQRI